MNTSPAAESAFLRTVKPKRKLVNLQFNDQNQSQLPIFVTK